MKITIKHIRLIVILFLVAACAQKISERQVQVRNDLVFNGFIIDVKANESALIRKLGKPQRVKTKTFKNEHYDDLQDAIITYYYPGLEVLYYDHRHPTYGWKNIVRIEIASDAYELKYGIKMGMHVSEIYKLFGDKDCHKYLHNNLNYISFLAHDSVHEQVIVALKDDKLVKFIWSNMP